MAVTQYIGARYVPLFADPAEWDSTREYEPLTIVLYQGSSYTSRQSVPKGIDILNTDFWVLTGNYNAQVEAYRREVREYDERITDNTNAISTEVANREAADNALSDNIDAEIAARKATDNDLSNALAAEVEARIEGDKPKELEIYQFDGKQTGENYTCTVVKSGDNAFLIDTGALNDKDAILAWFASLEIETFSAFFLTHMHYDHCENMESILRSRFVNADTDVYVQMQPTQANAEYGMYETWTNMLNNLLNNLGYPQAIIAENYKATEYGDVTVYVGNTDSSNKSRYDNSIANNGLVNTRQSSLNNYSLIARFECGTSSYVETGDIEGEGQRQNAQYMKPCTVARSPHHFANKQGWQEFFDRLNPEYWLISNHWATETNGEINVLNWRSCYLFKYLTFFGKDTPVVTNISTDVSFNIEGGVVTACDGYYVSKAYDPGSDYDTAPYNVYSLCPPNYYTDNPYAIVESVTLATWFDEMMPLFNGAATVGEFYLLRGGADAYQNSQIAQDIASYFVGLGATTRLYLRLQANFLYAYQNTYAAPYYQIKFWYDASLKNLFHTFEWANLTRSKGAPFNQTGLSLTTGDNMPSDAWNYLRLARLISITLSTGKKFSLIRGDGAKETGVQSAAFEGMTISSDLNLLYLVMINSLGAITAKRRNLTTGEISDITITGFSFTM